MSFQGYADDGIRCYLFFDVCARKPTQEIKCDMQFVYITFKINVDLLTEVKSGSRYEAIES